MPLKDDALKVNPLLAKLAARAGQSRIVEMEGYIGPADTGVVRLYGSLSMDSYTEIPKDGVIEAIECADSKDGRVKLYVADTTEVTEVSVTRGRAEALSAALQGRMYPSSPRLTQRGRTDTLRATCSRVDELIDAYEDALGGGGLFGGVVDTVPGLRGKIESRLRDAREFKARVCDPVLAV
jgi:hypothetical protein